jgi:hypothetical protein
MMSMRKRAARNTHKAEIRLIRPTHIVIAVECIGVYTCAYFYMFASLYSARRTRHIKLMSAFYWLHVQLRIYPNQQVQ